MKPPYEEWVYPTSGILALIVFMTIATTIVQDGKHKPANPVIRQLIDRT